MAAWKATRWILEALESIDKQEPRPTWTYSLRIGVDACPETSRLLLRAGRPHWYAQENVGPYVMRNSLIQLAPAAAYAVFDADDLMRKEYLQTLLAGVGVNGIAGGGRTQIDENRRIIRRRAGYKGGVSIISHGAWEKLGGYRAWPVAADHDLILRARALKVPVRPTNQALYLRRVHKASLTNDPRTGFKSELRRQFAGRAKHLTKLGKDLHVHPVCTELELRIP
jgi:hypothetical protein